MSVRKRSKNSYTGKNAVCHICKEEFPEDIGVRSRLWAFGIAGVRWVLCSKDCEQDMMESQDAS